jgi:hypothetical protein
MPPPYLVKTPNFSYILNMEEIKTPIHSITFHVGTMETPCLDASIFMPGIDDRLSHLIETASLHKIEALEQCALEYDEEKSFGTELLYSFINILKASYPHVKRITLHDASNIPCGVGDTLDLLTYSIAMHGKTWYEMKAGAYPKEDYEIYKNTINKYISPEFKKTIPFEDLFIYLIGNSYAKEIIEGSLSTYKNMYDSAYTFPEFFKALNKTVPKQLKCKFFKAWLRNFIGTYVRYSRDWTIDIDANSVLGNVLNVSRARPMQRTRKSRQRTTRKKK